MEAKPGPSHDWLQTLVGEWTFEGECVMGPDQPPMKWTGSEVVRSIGGLWIMAEATGAMPGTPNNQSVMTLGYDPARERFVGTFVASMMTHLWLYDGALDADRKILALDAEGPDFTNQKTAKYQDSIEIVDDDHRILHAKVLGDDGEWTQFMTTHYHRRK